MVNIGARADAAKGVTRSAPPLAHPQIGSESNGGKAEGSNEGGEGGGGEGGGGEGGGSEGGGGEGHGARPPAVLPCGAWRCMGGGDGGHVKAHVAGKWRW